MCRVSPPRTASALHGSSRYTQSPRQTLSVPAKTPPPAPPAQFPKCSLAQQSLAAAASQSPALPAPLPESSAETPLETRTRNFSHTSAPHSPAPATNSPPPECQSGTHTFSLLPAMLPPAQTQKSKTVPSPASTPPPSPETTRTSSPAPP